MKLIKWFIPVLLFFSFSLKSQDCADLFFSEYIEGSSNNKAIELYNPSSSPINLANYTIHRYNNGNTDASAIDTLSGTLESGDVYVIVNGGADESILINANIASNITFFNGDDVLELRNGDTVIDRFGVIGEQPEDGWAIGDGFSKENTLVRKSEILQGQTDWSIGVTEWDVYEQDDVSNLGSHVANNCDGSTDAIISFLNNNEIAEEGETVTVIININGELSEEVIIGVSVENESSADENDYDLMTSSLTIPAGTTEAQSFEITITDDMEVETEESILLTLSIIMGTADIGTGTQVITIPANDGGEVIPVLKIEEITEIDSEGVALSVDLECEIRGVVYGGNLRPTGLQFTLHDDTDGIAVFSFDVVNDYVVMEGDSLHIVGTVAQFRGLTQFSPTSINLVSSENELLPPTPVLTLNEDTESELIMIECVTLVDETDWAGDGSGFNATITDGINEYNMRIDNDVDLANMTAPNGTFDVVGIGSQFGNSTAPFLDGYQIMPRYAADIIETICTEITEPVVNLTANNTSVNEGETLSFDVELSNSNDFATNVTISFTDGSAENGTDYVFEETTLTFTANTDASQTIEIPITDDEEAEMNETFTILISMADNGAIINIGMIDFTILDNDTEIPSITLGEVTTLDTDGVSIYDGQTVELNGIVYGGNLNGSGLQFTLIGDGGGISVYSPTPVSGYEVNEGDEVTVVGEIENFFGLLEIVPTSIELLSQNNEIKTPTAVNELSEATESDLVQINCVTLVDETQWTGEGTGFNVTVTTGTQTYTIRIDDDTDLYNMEAPTGTFDIVGIGGQFDSSPPYDEGYQLLPRNSDDFIEKEAPSSEFEELFTLIDAPVNEFQALVEGDYTYTWDFGDGNTDTGFHIQHSYSAGGQYTVCLTVSTNNECIVSSTTCMETFAQLGNSIDNISFQFNVSPNPTTNFFEISSKQIIDEINITNIEGKTIFSTTNKTQNLTINVENWESGVYFIELVIGDKKVRRKVVKL